MDDEHAPANKRERTKPRVPTVVDERIGVGNKEAVGSRRRQSTAASVQRRVGCRVLTLVATAVLIVLLVRVAQRFRGSRSPLFEIEFERGRLIRCTGTLPDRMRRDLIRVARDGDVSGTVRYFPTGEIAFSRDVQDGAEQRFRNVLALA